MGSIIDGVLVIVNGTLIDGTGAKPRPNGAIVMRGTTIAEVHATNPRGFDPRATMIDAAGKFILPGLIDGHVHLSMYQGAPAGVTSPASAEFCALRAAENLLPILRAGITSVSVPGGKWFVDVTLRDAHQCLWATRMTTAMMADIAPRLDRAGFEAHDVHMSDLIGGVGTLAGFSGLVACGGFSYGE